MSTPSDLDHAFLRRAFRLAMNGRGLVEPNPMVGCVLVKNGQIIGEGWHGRFGGPHAEPTALADCRARGNDPAGATAYVTLEPCCHTNKKTPPCAPQVIEAKIARVVIGCLDPNPAVNGKGVAMLRAAGMQVDGPVLEGEAKQLIAPFLATTDLRRPHVTLKWAQTADGKVAGAAGKRLTISNPASSRVTHRLRARCDAIVIGARTMRVDDPVLTARHVELHRRLTRVVLAGDWDEMGGSLLRTVEEGPVILYVGEDARWPAPQEAKLARCGVTLQYVQPDSPGHVSLPAVLSDLAARGATHVLVEPGPTLAAAFFAAGLVDRLWVFESPRRVEDLTAPSAAAVPSNFAVTGRLRVEGDVLTEHLNPSGQAFYAPMPSADFVIEAEKIELVGSQNA